MDYKEVGFRCGIEIHNRLATNHKLFCGCKARFSRTEPVSTFVRRLRPVAGETGRVDVAAQYEYLRNKEYKYETFPNESCLVDADEEPPHAVNGEALVITLQVAKMLKARIPDELHVMRKTVIDGSNTCGFQRTIIVGSDGVLETTRGPVRITNISLEEEASGIVSKDGSEFRLDRLGIPMIEIGTDTDIVDPEHAREVAERLGMIVRSTGMSQRGIGVTRQDVNVSIRGGARVEIKGFQDLDSIPDVIEKEIMRQKQHVLEGKKVAEETRLAKPDCTTEYMRPLPGGNRMYPETDVPTIVVTKEMLSKIKIPETWEQKERRLGKILPEGMVRQMIRSEYLMLFERLAKDNDPTLVASTFLSTVKGLHRQGKDTALLTDRNFEDVLYAVTKGSTAKESIPNLLTSLIDHPDKTVGELIASEGLGKMNEHELRAIVRNVINANPQHAAAKNLGPLMGDVMKQVRGRVDGATVARVLKEMLK